MKIDDIRGIKEYLKLLSNDAVSLEKKRNKVLKGWGVDDMNWEELDKVLKDEGLMMKIFNNKKQKEK